jgi:hypothetical protein
MILLHANCVSLLMQKKKGTQGVIQIENPNLVKAKNVKAKDVDVRPYLSFI